MNKKQTNKKKLAEVLVSPLVKLGVVLLIIMLSIQLGVLATLGTKGAEVTEIRAEKKYLREEIDSLKADIDSAKTLAEIENGIGVVYREQRVSAKPIEINQTPELDTVGLLPNNGN